ncbi:chromo domain-containing protein cec-1-like [Mytilus edulis]|uniref:chromo domain-containing protein cec-1-like n=1 Tax=Mytilus edulis TaxID=6550 RepID=UPI0039EEA709
MSDDDDNEEEIAEDDDEIVRTDTQPDSNDPTQNDTQVQRNTNDVRNNDDSDLYLVERIVKSKRINNKMHYYIKWLGFGSTSNSWEPEENIPPELRHEFKVRMDQNKRIKARKTKK